MPRFLLMCLAIAALTLFPVLTEPPARVAPGRVSTALPDAAHARQWLENQRAALLAMPARTPATRREISTRLRIWRAAGRRLARDGGVWSPRGFVVYPPQVTLALFLLDRVETLYAAAEDGRPAIPSADALLTLAGQELVPTAPEKLPSVRRARSALESLAVPSTALRGYRVYLLPFSMGDVSGQGGPGFAFVAAEPEDEVLIRDQLEVTLVHEFGHHLHLTGMPRGTLAGRAKWRDYLRLRSLTWRDDGRVNTESWAGSSEETFAEDFRLLFGGRRAADEPAATAAGDPRALGRDTAKIRRFIATLADEAGPVSSLDPWPEEEAAAWAGGGRNTGPWKIGAALILSLALLCLAARWQPRGAAVRPFANATGPFC